MTCDSRFPLKILVKCDPFEIVFLPGCFIFVTVVVFFFLLAADRRECNN